ncbi:MAG: alanine racemase [Chloroflexi bacterium]|nr:alanine racemase [Chloroflexota bacterium]
MPRSGLSAAWQGRPLWAEVDLDALAHNVAVLRRRVPRSELMAVVKANAYGHGAVAVAAAALGAGASRLGVACVDEAVQLRAAGIEAPILVLGHSPPHEAAALVAHDVTATIDSLALADVLSAEAQRRGRRLPVHMEVDTGMSRFGLSPVDAVTIGRALSEREGLELEGLYTHFATADEADKGFTHRQYEALLWAAEQLGSVAVRHAANSAAVLDLPEMALEMVRPGISLYGIYPSGAVARGADLRPVLSLRARVARTHWLQPGQAVSYGRTWVAERATRIALVPCGYADGLRRGLSNRASLLVRGRRAPIRGRVCMDSCMVDVTDLPDVAVGDEVTIIGVDGDAVLPVEELAELEGTIPYEILCGISARVPRLFLRDGQMVSTTTLVSAGAAVSQRARA